MFTTKSKMYKISQKVLFLFDGKTLSGTVSGIEVDVLSDLSYTVVIKVFTEQKTFLLIPEELYTMEDAKDG